MKQFLIICLVIVYAHLFIQPCAGCSCIITTFRDSYCNAEWVSHVRILDVQLNSAIPSHWEYTVEHVQVFKPSGGILPTLIETPESSATCGVDGLEEGKEYLLEGRFEDNETLGIHMCSFINIRRWTFSNGNWDDPEARSYMGNLPYCKCCLWRPWCYLLELLQRRAVKFSG
ncbi:tissue inhibitor of metalloproteinase domain-containing protein [Ditylenchus destructor]|nr:tissue inhibitor of metalloproteinase domain-containing protein [Ditylenchus destructor]